MTTFLKTELSKKSKYWIEKHRYYELKHFCLQYPIWKKALCSLDGLSRRPTDFMIFAWTNEVSDPTAKCAIVREYYSKRMKIIQQVAEETDPVLAKYILLAVTEGHSYDYLKARLEIPCCRDMYYDRYRKFFWLLNKARD